MDSIPVTLIVKAPNQQIEDQTIKCELSWTIKRLKGYLSEVYPSKPRTEEQKLIYSGQLLPDTVVLKDVLRRYEGQETHTFHLVCAPSKEFVQPKSAVRSFRAETPPGNRNNMAQVQPAPNINPSHRDEEVTAPSRQPSTSSSENVAPNSSPASSPAASVESRQEVPITATHDPRTAWAGAMGQPYVPQFAGDPHTYAAQMAWFQQAYVNYMTQYMQFYSNGVPNINNAGDSNQENGLPNRDEQRVINNIAPGANIAAGGVPEVPNVIGNEGEDGIIDRDWLDWFYVFSRIIVLISIVYFYSSPFRFILVVVLGCAVYLYQMGFFRGQLENNVNINNNVDDGAENNNNRRNNARRGAGEAVPPAPEEAPNVAPRTAQPRVTPIEEERPTMLGVMWTFFTTFFASLIPEIPNAV